jgi:hypothetical protein
MTTPADTSGAGIAPPTAVDMTPEEIASMRAILAQVDAGAPAPADGAPVDVTPAPPDPTFTLGQLVVYEWTDDYDVNAQVRYGLVVGLPTVGDAGVAAPDQLAGYGIAWFAPGHARVAAADLKAV